MGAHNLLAEVPEGKAILKWLQAFSPRWHKLNVAELSPTDEEAISLLVVTRIAEGLLSARVSMSGMSDVLRPRFVVLGNWAPCFDDEIRNLTPTSWWLPDGEPKGWLTQVGSIRACRLTSIGEILKTGLLSHSPNEILELVDKQTSDISYAKLFRMAVESLPSPATKLNRQTRTKHPPKRAWTKPDLNAAILEYKAKRSSNYNQHHAAVQRGDNGARKAAQDMFGRNAIAEALGVKEGSRRMISESPAWQEIARELELDTRAETRKKIGLEIASEKKAEALGDLTADDIAKREVLESLQRRLRAVVETDDRRNIESLIDEIHTGRKTPDQVLEVLKILDGE